MTGNSRPRPETSLDATAPRRLVALAMLGCFWPGHEATGPNQSFNALASTLHEEFEFKVVALNRTIGPEMPVAVTGRWYTRETHSVRYVSGGLWGVTEVAAILRETPHDVLVLNGFFDRDLTIPALLARRLGLAPRRPSVVLSPRGEFSAGREALAKWHKRAYLAASRRLGLLHSAIMHATGEGEADDIRREYPWAKRIVVAPNIRSIGEGVGSRDFATGAGQPLQLVFLSRIDRKKNLHTALDILRTLGEPVTFDIYGPVSEEAYWQSCQAQIEALPANVTVSYKGAIPNADVPRILAGYDAFFLPTEGENFGHAIVDALAAGLPVLISDMTPWSGLEQRSAGWSLPLDKPEAFAAAIRALGRMDPAARSKLSLGARRYIETSLAESDAVDLNRRMLHDAIVDTGRPYPAEMTAAHDLPATGSR